MGAALHWRVFAFEEGLQFSRKLYETISCVIGDVEEGCARALAGGHDGDSLDGKSLIRCDGIAKFAH